LNDVVRLCLGQRRQIAAVVQNRHQEGVCVDKKRQLSSARRGLRLWPVVMGEAT
jgi:hypothetical protein